MDPLQHLWDLYEGMMEKPSLQDEAPATMGSPNEENFDHPVTQQRRQVDMMRASGVDAEQAHENVFGEVDTGDSMSKAQLASTLSRVQNDGNRKGVKIEKDTEHKSLLAMDDEMEKRDAVTPDDLRTPTQKEVPNALQAPGGQEQTVGESVDIKDVWDYNDDIAYLQTYGRA
jgi:hypothetical protein